MGKRLDIYIVEQKIAKSRTLAQSFIEDGKIILNGKTAKKPSETVNDGDKVEFVGELPKYVGRGGLKLEKALAVFSIDIKDLVCLDVGASTGGFTDCMLQSGAKKVYAVDVGRSQLDEKLKADRRVVSVENTDIRKAENEIPEKVDFAAIDVSFISLKLILPEVKRFLNKGQSFVALIKPQFEAGKRFLGKNGVIKDKKLLKSITSDISAFCESIGFEVKGITQSPVLGGDGNTEFLIYLGY